MTAIKLIAFAVLFYFTALCFAIVMDKVSSNKQNKKE